MACGEVFETHIDGSKYEQKVAAVTFYPEDSDNPGAIPLRDGSSVFNAELEGILLALNKFSTMTKTYKKFIIYTDSFSVVESLQGKTFRIKNSKCFYNILKTLPPQIKIIIAWIPSLVCITGNERADSSDLQKQPCHRAWPHVPVYVDETSDLK